MNKISTDILQQTTAFVKDTLANAEKGHDWLHIARVHENALRINEVERGDSLIVQLSALLHDIADPKFNDGNEEIGPTMAGDFLVSLKVDSSVIYPVVEIIKNLSYKSSLGTVTFQSKELDIVQDADRLDALGAIGIARAFTYGGYMDRLMYDPEIKPNWNMTKEEYKKSNGPTINHFYEKLLRLKDLMKTGTGKRMAEQRHQFMLAFLEHFHAETGTPKPH